MFEFQKLCREIEALSPSKRAMLLSEKSIAVIKGLRELGAMETDPVVILASFIIGSVVSDGSISEKDYLFIYPSLQKAVGNECDLAAIKRSVKVSKDIQKTIAVYTQELLAIISEADEQLGNDLISLCLLVTSADGKISLKEKRYIKQLCKA